MPQSTSVPVRAALEIGQQDAAGRGRGYRAVQREIVAADAVR